MESKTYRTGRGPRLVNALFTWLARRGLGPQTLHVLTTTGRRTGKPRSVPVHLLEDDGSRWLVAIYGFRGWVHNVAEDPRVQLMRAGRNESARLEAAPGTTASRVLERYVDRFPHVRPYLGEGPIDWETAARGHPVFQVHRR